MIAEIVGVHPAAWAGPDGYTERTPEMEEHNTKVIRFFRARVQAEEALKLPHIATVGAQVPQICICPDGGFYEDCPSCFPG